jgi:hypothetical protein
MKPLVPTTGPARTVPLFLPKGLTVETEPCDLDVLPDGSLVARVGRQEWTGRLKRLSLVHVRLYLVSADGEAAPDEVLLAVAEALGMNDHQPNEDDR